MGKVERLIAVVSPRLGDAEGFDLFKDRPFRSPNRAALKLHTKRGSIRVSGEAPG
jgi:hypothetical protein